MPSLTWKGKEILPAQPARLTLDSIIYPSGQGYPHASIRDRLILGDNQGVMSALMPELEGKIRLIYADPPFFTNRQYAARIGRGEDSRRPGDWARAEAYSDHWPDMDAYLAFLYPRLVQMHKLLGPGGTLYLHLDWHVNSYARVVLDEVFGAENLLNEIIWTYHGPSPIRTAFNRKHDTILAYVKGPGHYFDADAVREPYNPSTIRTFGGSPRAGFGKVPNLARGKVPEDWWYFPVVARLHKERTGYPTQKPQALLERIILASSRPGELVADFFSGSGTTAVVAARHGRRFLAVDSSFRAIHSARRRLCAVQSSPFSIERDDNTRMQAAALPAEEVQRSAFGVRLKTTRTVDYWEVDPEWDGSIFRSVAQAQRANAGTTLPQELEVKPGRRACVGLVTDSGELFRSALDV